LWVLGAVTACYLVDGFLQLLKAYFAAIAKIEIFTTKLETNYSYFVYVIYTIQTFLLGGS